MRLINSLLHRFVYNNSHKRGVPLIERLIVVILIAIVIINQYFIYKDFSWTFGALLWFCDLSIIALVLGLLFRNAVLVTAILITAIPAQFMWILDFFNILITGSTFGRNSWILWSSFNNLAVYSSIIMHFVLIPSALFAVYRLGFDKRAILIAYIYGAFILIASYFFTEHRLNTNCVFYPCDSASLSIFSLLFNWQAQFGSIEFLIKTMLDWAVYITITYTVILLIRSLLFKLKFVLKE